MGTPSSVQDTEDGTTNFAVSTQNAFSLTDGTNANTTLGAQTQASVSDGAAPVITDFEYRDNSANGQIDRIFLSFSETLDAGSVLAANDLNITNVGDFTSAAFGTDGTDLITGAVSSVEITLGTPSSVQDTEDGSTNFAVSSQNGFSLTDGSNTNNTLGAQTQASVSDGAAPIIVTYAPALSATGVAVGSNITMTFSEDITDQSSGDITLEDITGPNTDDRAQAVLALDIGGTTSDELVINPNTNLLNLNEYSVSIPGTRVDDTNGNSFAGLNGSTNYNFTTIGSTPTITDAEWRDSDGDGNIDQVHLTFSENVNIADGDDAGGTGLDCIVISGGINIDATPNYDNTNIGSITLDIDDITGTATPSNTVTYDNTATNSAITSNAGAVEIGNGEVVAGGGTYSDGAAPAITDFEYRDNNEDGQIDRVLVTFSETLDAGSVLSANDLNITNVGDFTSAAFGTDGTDLITGSVGSVEITLGTASTVQDTEDGTTNFAVSTQNGFSLTDGTNTNTTLAAQTHATVTDGAAPVITDIEYRDNNEDGQVDRVFLTFSETLNAGSVLAANDLNITNTGDFTSAAFGTDGTDLITGAVGSVEVTLGTASSVIDTEDGSTNFAVSTQNGFSLTDGTNTNNTLAAQTQASVSDGAAPVISDFEYRDNNEDGLVDRVLVSFSETLDAGSVLSANDLNITNVGDFTSAAFGTDGTDLITGSVGSVEVTLGTASTVIDTEDGSTNFAVSTQNGFSLTDGTNTNNTLAAQSQASVSDGAAPVISDFEYRDNNSDGQIDRVFLTFSETLDAGSFLSANDLNITNVGDFTSAAFGTDGTDLITGSVSTVEVTLGTAASVEDTEDGSTNFAISTQNAFSLTDGTNSNTTLAAQSQASVSDGAPPVVTDLEIFDAGEDGLIERIDITFSENVDTDNGDAPVIGDLGTLTLPDGTAITTAPTISDPALGTNVVSVTAITDQATIETGPGSTDIDLLVGLWEDAAGNAIVAAGDDSETITDSAEPILIYQSPAHLGTAGVATNIDLVFSEVPVPVTTFDVTVTDEDDGSSTQSMDVVTSGTVIGDTLRIDVTTDLDFNTNYSVQVDASSVDDAAGNSYDGITGSTAYTFTTVASSSLSAGDIAFVGWDADDNDNFAIVVLTDLDGSSTPFDIRFTDNEWDGVSSFNTGSEGEIIWTINVLVSAGTIVHFGDVNTTSPTITAGTGSVARSGDFLINTNNEAVFAFDGTGISAVSAVLAGISSDGNSGWGSLANSGLVEGTTAVDFDGVDDDLDGGEYTGSRSGLGNFAGYLTLVNDPTNWATTDGGTANTVPPFDMTAFTIDTDPPGVTSITPSPLVLSDSDVGAGNFTVAVLFDEATDGTTAPSISFNGDVVSSGTITFTGGAWTTNTNTDDTYTATYTVADVNETVADIDISVNGAVDAVGNTQTVADTENDEFDVDTENPTFTAAHFFDTNSDGDIDEVVIEMSEEIDEGSFEFGDFTFGAGSASAVSTVASTNVANTLDANDNDEYVTLEVSITGTSTVTVAYAGGGSGFVADVNGNVAADDPSITEVDAAPPAIIAAVTDDADADGLIDAMSVTLSENLVDGSSTFGTGTFSVTGYTGATASSGGVDDNQVDVTFTEGSTADTDATPNITLNLGQLSDGTVSLTGNQTFTGTTDGAAPAIFTIDIQDTGGDGLIDQLVVTFSENVDTDNGDAPVLADFGTILLPDGETVSSATISDPTGSSASITLSVIGDQIAIQTDAGSTGISGVTTEWTDGTNQTVDPDGFVTITDSADPIFTATPDDNGGDNNYTGGETITFNIALSETVSGTVDLTGLNSGFSSAADMTPATGTTLTYTTVDMVNANEGTGISIPFEVTDLSGNTGNDGTLTVDIDKTDPVVTINNLTTNVASPELTGTISDNLFTNATVIEITVNAGGPYTATNNNDGTWTLSAGTIPALASNTYDVTVAAEDPVGNIGNDATTNELVIDLDAPTFDTQTTSTDDANTTITVNLNETGTVYYVFLADGNVNTPTGADVAAGQDGAAVAALFSGSITVNSAVSDFDEIVALADQTDYDLYLAAEDDAGNLQTAAEAVINISTGGVNITAPTLSNLCLDDSPTTLGDIVITERILNDFETGASQTLRLGLPTDFTFDTGVTPTLSETGSDVSGLSHSYISSNILEITFTVGGETTTDVITIADLDIQASGSAQTSLTITRVGGDASIYLADESDSRVFGTLSSRAIPTTPTIEISTVTTTETQINIGDNITLDASGAGGTYNWYYNNQSSLAATGASVTQAALNGGTFPNNFNNNSAGLFTLYMSENDGFCNSDFAKINVWVFEARSSAGTTSFFDNDTEGDTLFITENNFHEVDFSGNGIGVLADDLTGTIDTARVRFIPSTAGVGSHDMDITTTNESTGETYTFTRTYTVNSAASIFSNSPSTEHCTNGAIQAIVPDLTGYPGGFSFYAFDASAGVSGTLSNTADWTFDPTGLGATETDYTIVRLLDDGVNKISFGASTFTVFPEPSISIENNDGEYCENSSDWTISATLDNGGNSSSGINFSSFDIRQTSPVTTGYITVSSGSVDFSDLFNNAGDYAGLTASGAGTYEVVVTTSSGNDPYGDGPGCTTSATFTFDLYEQPSIPTLTDVGGSSPGAQTDFEYCDSEVVPDLTVTGTGEIRFYETLASIGTADSIAYGGGGTIDPFFLGLDDLSSLVSSGSPVFVKTFYATQVTNSGGSFNGCESDFLEMNITVYYTEPSQPTMTSLSGGQLLASGDVLLEYCLNDVIPNITVDETTLFSTTVTESYFNWYPDDGGGNPDTSSPLTVADADNSVITPTEL
ncbi:MAG: Ig-like domain-containing protein [bacterium]|nr:Ig-like domain-containing protein [bacterium]